MSKTSEAIARARNAARNAKTDATETVAGAATSYFLGSLESSGAINSIPQVMGMPRTLTLALLGKGVAYFTGSGGTMHAVANGIGNAATHVGLYQLASRGSVSGGDVLAGRRDGEVDRALRAMTGPGAERRIAAVADPLASAEAALDGKRARA